MALADILPTSRVAVLDIDNGGRFETYAIEGERGQICLNGAAARLVSRGQGHPDHLRRVRPGRARGVHAESGATSTAQPGDRRGIGSPRRPVGPHRTGVSAGGPAGPFDVLVLGSGWPGFRPPSGWPDCRHTEGRQSRWVCSPRAVLSQSATRWAQAVWAAQCVRWRPRGLRPDSATGSPWRRWWARDEEPCGSWFDEGPGRVQMSLIALGVEFA